MGKLPKINEKKAKVHLVLILTITVKFSETDKGFGDEVRTTLDGNKD